jgi:hypothetical protein
MKGSKINGCSLFLIPMPVSDTENLMMTVSSSLEISSASISTEPWLVNFRLFSNKFVNTCCI